MTIYLGDMRQGQQSSQNNNLLENVLHTFDNFGQNINDLK